MGATPNNDNCSTTKQTSHDAFRATLLVAALYVVSGVAQPLLMELAKEAGLADKSCQVYMQFYYLGTASVILLAPRSAATTDENDGRQRRGLSRQATLKTVAVASVDIIAQTLNYSGATMAGPTIFAIVYSSVTVWCALLSHAFLGRTMSRPQWTAVFVVFLGLGITGWSSLDLGPEVTNGTALVALGSCLHAVMYVASEAVMNHGKEPVSSQQYCAVYGAAAFGGYLAWQLCYTRTHFRERILGPMHAAGTSAGYALTILFAIAFASMIHSASFFHTVKHLPGGSTSAGVLKALQAVFVFAATSVAFCDRVGGEEMCFTVDKFASLCVVVAGVVLFGRATETGDESGPAYGESSPDGGYRRIRSLGEVEMEAAVREDPRVGLDTAVVHL